MKYNEVQKTFLLLNCWAKAKTLK